MHPIERLAISLFVPAISEIELYIVQHDYSLEELYYFNPIQKPRLHDFYLRAVNKELSIINIKLTSLLDLPALTPEQEKLVEALILSL